MKPDSDGFVTLHRGRTPLLQRVATVLLLVFVWVLFWKMTDAKGQPYTSNSTVATCFSGGFVWPARNGMCYSEDAGRGSLISTTGGSITNKTWTCDPNWMLVRRGEQWMCASELREPK